MDEPNEKRSSLIKSKSGTGKTLELMGRLHIDLSFQGRAFLGGATIKLKLTPSKQDFSLIVKGSTIKPVLNLESAILYVRRAKINPAVVHAHNQALLSKPAKYPITRSEVKTSVIQKDTVDVIVENLVNGKLPRRLFIGFVSNEAINGSLAKNPFNFKLYNISFINCYVNGQPYPAIPFQPNVEEGLTLREYYSLMDASNQTGTSTYIDIDREDFNKGFGIFGFNLSPDLSDGCGMSGHVNKLKVGNIRVQVIFKKPLPEAVTMITYCEFDSLMQIDVNRNPIVDQM